MNHPYAEFIHRVDKPARYLGGEYMATVKDWATVQTRFCLAFPDVYDIGMSHLGTKILYSLLNKFPTIACERAFTPWPDMEKQLRLHQLPILSLESARPLRDFDAIGCSLQYELTYSNVLTLLDLGGIPLRAVDRGESDPIVWGGGPTATHPEPVAPFFDCLLIGEGEEALPRLLLIDALHKKQGFSRRERLIKLAALGGVYVPSLYSTKFDSASARVLVDRPLDPRVPSRVSRLWVEDINKYPFPDDSPVAWAEAVFDRVSVEIARGCTEGCRFCQAGMIYRPVRERDPDAIVDSLVGAIKKGGYDEASLTALSTADYSCITPLVKRIGKKLREDKVSLSVSSLRAYGLGGDLLDEIASVRAGGLTFAPEAGTQRMRDVINKNVTEEDITRSAQNVFSRGFSRMKLYFMIGLPTETDEDVVGIAQTGGRLRRHGKKIRKDAEVVVSVSSHVPKPHTPFQWCSMDTLAEIRRKQRLLRETADKERVQLKWHESETSWLEGIYARGDRRVADVLETAWKNGARFDGWEEHLDLDIWRAAFTEHALDPEQFHSALPEHGRLPWDHIDIGLEDGFLLDEYKKAIKDRAAPPCGKVHNVLLHHSNIEDAEADQRKLVCYDCGVACDMTNMRAERLVFLRRLGATKPVVIAPAALPPSQNEPGVSSTSEIAPSILGGAADGISGIPMSPKTSESTESVPAEAGSSEGASSPVALVAPVAEVPGVPANTASIEATPPRALERGESKPRAAFVQEEGVRYRLRYTKIGRAAFISHLDTSRLLQRLFRRAGIELFYSRGFHPKPELSFGPALGLGVAALGEVVDFKLDSRSGIETNGEALLVQLRAAAPEGVRIERVVRLADGDAGVAKVIVFGDYVTLVPPALLDRFDPDRPPSTIRRMQKGEQKIIDVAKYLVSTRFVEGEEGRILRAILEWPASAGEGEILFSRVRVGGDGSVRPVEVVESLFGEVPDTLRYARLALWAGTSAADSEASVDELIDPLDTTALAALAHKRVRAAQQARAAG